MKLKGVFLLTIALLWQLALSEVGATCNPNQKIDLLDYEGLQSVWKEQISIPLMQDLQRKGICQWDALFMLKNFRPDLSLSEASEIFMTTQMKVDPVIDFLQEFIDASFSKDFIFSLLKSGISLSDATPIIKKIGPSLRSIKSILEQKIVLDDQMDKGTLNLQLYRSGILSLADLVDNSDNGITQTMIEKSAIKELQELSLFNAKRRFLQKRARQVQTEMAIDFLQKEKYNEALWEYQQIGDAVQSNQLNNKLEKIMSEGEIIFVKNMGRGSTGAKKVKLILPSGEFVYAIMKKETADEISSTSNEVFASKLNDYLGLHLVPKTVKRMVDGVATSFQYFWAGEGSIDRNTLSNAPAMNDLHVFDHLIQSGDRDEKNYFPTSRKMNCGRSPFAIAIDNGAIWGLGPNVDLIVNDPALLIPSFRVYKALLAMKRDKDNRFLKQMMTEGLITAEQAEDLVIRRDKILSYVKQQMMQKGIRGVWPTVDFF